MKNGVLIQKLAAMAETLDRLQEYLPSSYEELAKDWGRQKVVERALQILIEAMIDIGERLIAISDGLPSETSAAVMERLQKMGVIRAADRYIPMVRFRNLLVHQYERIDVAVLYGILNKKLGDFEAFLSEIKAYVQTH
jgi:uncharacterized protein YutE (UPF0331/DUF86 family)